MRNRVFAVVTAWGEAVYKGSWRKCRNYIDWKERNGVVPGILKIQCELIGEQRLEGMKSGAVPADETHGYGGIG